MMLRSKKAICSASEGNGLMATSKGFDYERLIDAFNAYGQALCAYEDACRYANQRIVKGQEIGRLQLIQEPYHGNDHEDRSYEKYASSLRMEQR